MSAFNMLVSAEEESACLAEEGKVVNYEEGCASNAKMWGSESALIAQGILAWIVTWRK